MKVRTIHTQKTLSPTQITLADYVINPYRGCEFGCLYCYCQGNKNIKRDGFYNVLSVKINSAEVLRKELRFIKPERVLLGSTTECFQNSENYYRLSKEIIAILNQKNIPYTILTKSDLISDYLELIKENCQNKIYFTFNFASNKLIALFEKKSPTIEQRLQCIKKIISHGINLRIHIGPYFPYLSEAKAILKLLPEGIDEIDIELYHQKQGNFRQILKTVRENIGRETAENIEKVYSGEKTYENYADQLRENATVLATQHNLRIYCIIPGFNEFYTSKITYE